jgi:OTU domain-containing protein 5
MGTDGNCLFRSISDQLYGSNFVYLGCETYHADIRALCLDYIQHEQYFFENYIEGDFAQYVSEKRQDGEWGDDV